jgi:hypothetical protein
MSAEKSIDLGDPYVVPGNVITRDDGSMVGRLPHGDQFVLSPDEATLVEAIRNGDVKAPERVLADLYIQQAADSAGHPEA